MESIINMEVISINEVDGVHTALISYQDLKNVQDINNGYATARVPINLRPIQFSVRGNMLVDQSVKSSEPTASKQ